MFHRQIGLAQPVNKFNKNGVFRSCYGSVVNLDDTCTLDGVRPRLDDSGEDSEATSELKIRKMWEDLVTKLRMVRINIQ